MVSQRDLRASEVDCGEIGVAELWARWRVPSKIASVLTGFRAIPFAQNQTCKEKIQRVRLCMYFVDDVMFVVHVSMITSRHGALRNDAYDVITINGMTQ